MIDPATGFALVRPAVPEPTPEGGVRLRPVERFELRPPDGAPAGALRLVDAETGQPVLREESLFDRIASAARQAVLASMIAYLFAQFVDVWLFHFWKKLTAGKHLWLRNNGSTLVSQLVDTVCVVSITFWGAIMSGEMAVQQVLTLIGAGYTFKLIVALLDTVPFYIGVHYLSRWLRIDPHEEHSRDIEAVAPR